jgi:DNA processing protein
MNKIYEIEDTDELYPEKLLKISKYPQKLYVMGNVKLLNNKCVAMVGSRDNTSYGEYYASKFSNALSKAGITVVSGLAIGIDRICHENSMYEKGKTIAVLGSGFNNIYPEENIKLLKEILKNKGAVVSEYPPETGINLSKFPIRNRIIAGLSECTIVVEAKARSGSSVTARHAFEQGKKVFCVPGRIGDKTGKGTNKLINKGAILLTDVNDVLAEFNIENFSKDNNKIVKIGKEYKEIYKLLQKSPMNVNEIARKLNINIAEVNMKLTMMEMEGYIEVMPGNIIKIKEY